MLDCIFLCLFKIEGYKIKEWVVKCVLSHFTDIPENIKGTSLDPFSNLELQNNGLIEFDGIVYNKLQDMPVFPLEHKETKLPDSFDSIE